jgi:hypothetical protein
MKQIASVLSSWHRWTPAFAAAGLCAVLLLVPYAASNDSAASTAAGGIRLLKENRISIAKERLTIAEERITVEYVFVNETDQAVSTEVAFPVPPYRLMMDDPGAPRSFDDFRIWVEGKELNYQTEVKANSKGSDCSAALRRFGIDIGSFGHIKPPPDLISADFARLSSPQQKELADAGLFAPDPAWTVEKTYHWPMVFAAHGTVHVRHEYAPVHGFGAVPVEALDPVRRNRLEAEERRNSGTTRAFDPYAKIDAACIDPAEQKKLAQVPTEDGHLFVMWIDYILTTANNWKTPIREFELLVERPGRETRRRAAFNTWHVHFCWDGPVSKVDPDHFLARKANFVPQRDLCVVFLGVR